MGKLNNAKLFGGLGAILMLIGAFIPFANFILPFIGLILMFVAVKYIADETRDASIFNNYLFYFIASFIAIVALIAGLIITIGSLGVISEIGEKLSDVDTALSFIGGIIISLIIFWVLLIIATIYLRKSYNRIAKHTGVDMFRTTGTVYFIGAITLIILIGVLIILIAKILEIVSFFSLPNTLPASKTMEISETETLT